MANATSVSFHAYLFVEILNTYIGTQSFSMEIRQTPAAFPHVPTLFKCV